MSTATDTGEELRTSRFLFMRADSALSFLAAMSHCIGVETIEVKWQRLNVTDDIQIVVTRWEKIDVNA